MEIRKANITPPAKADQGPATDALLIRKLGPEVSGQKLEKKPFKCRKLPWRDVRMKNRLSRSLALDRISDSKLEDLVDLARKTHPLPRERQVEISQTHCNWFLAQLQDLSSDRELADFAYSLNQKELSLLFPILATTGQKANREKIKAIISLRRSKVLYNHGWVTLQYIYPDNRIAKALAKLCQDLEGQKLPGPQARQAAGDHLGNPGSGLYYPNFNWSNIHLISEICRPDHRHFVQQIVRYLVTTETNPADFFETYAIYHDLALGSAILANYELEKLELKLAEEGDKVGLGPDPDPDQDHYVDLNGLGTLDDDLL